MAEKKFRKGQRVIIDATVADDFDNGYYRLVTAQGYSLIETETTLERCSIPVPSESRTEMPHYPNKAGLDRLVDPPPAAQEAKTEPGTGLRLITTGLEPISESPRWQKQVSISLEELAEKLRPILSRIEYSRSAQAQLDLLSQKAQPSQPSPYSEDDLMDCPDCGLRLRKRLYAGHRADFHQGGICK